MALSSIKSRLLGRDSVPKTVIHMQRIFTDKEISPKKKHVRAVILATFDLNSCQFFFEYCMQLPIYSSYIHCWKFLYMTNKLLRSGHPTCISDCLDQSSKIARIKYVWDSTNSSDFPVRYFIDIILKKLQIFRKYPYLPGTFKPDEATLSQALASTADHQFQLSIDLMDQLESILVFQRVVLEIVDRFHRGVSIQAGRCKLVTVVQCIQDSAALYELIVSFLFSLSTNLDKSIMVGHTTRFGDLHDKLKMFYEKVAGMRYFRNFLQVPRISNKPPNFDLQSERNRHMKIVIVENESATESDSDDSSTSARQSGWSERAEDRIPGKESLIKTEERCPQAASSHPGVTQQQIDQLTEALNTQVSKNSAQEERMKQMNTVYQQLHEKHAMAQKRLEELQASIEQEKVRNASLQSLVNEQSSSISRAESEQQNMTELKQSLNNMMQENAKQQEKLDRLKEIYGKLREEHISTLKTMSDLSESVEQEKVRSADMQSIINKVGEKLGSSANQPNGAELLEKVSQITEQLRNMYTEGSKCQLSLEEKVAEVAKLKAILANREQELADHEILRQNLEALTQKNTKEGEQLGKTMESTIGAIQAAEAKFKALLARYESDQMSSRSANQLQVDKLILDQCSNLLVTIAKLVLVAQRLQLEVQGDVKSGTLPSSFYKPNSRWNEGLLSAAKSVGACANVMIEVADGVISDSNVSMDKLIVVAHEVSASTVQLLMASKTKSNDESASLQELQLVCRDVSKATTSLAESVKSTMEAQVEAERDFDGLTFTQAKRVEIETQANILKLEALLSRQREELAKIRRANYKNDSEITMAPPTGDPADRS